MPVWMRRDKHSSGRLDGCIHILGTGESKWDGSVLRWSTCRMVGVNIYIAVQCQGSRCTLPLPLGHRAGPGFSFQVLSCISRCGFKFRRARPPRRPAAAAAAAA